ncbi:MAG: FHA domain-containing protein [Candidatus Auribacter fodinae]|uniref:FHA domain-containing protein n=1 Tax=Candidatus Auribacter fodinae TaxID=2093366 RepID=A0A3A4R1Y5_9BACT|nr:MAG: FHA domain-containing protein [Candidatus Auribacter fodinae]
MDYPELGSIIDDKYEIIDILGEGGTALVLKCTNIQTGNIYAIKRFIPERMSPVLKSRIFDEAKLTVKSNYIAKAIKTFKADGFFHQLLYFLPGRDLSDILNSGGPLDEQTSVYYALCMARAVADLTAAHSGIVITDLKPENSRIIDPSGKLVIFDLSCFEFAGKYPEFSQGTMPYAPPELINREILWQSTDIYSIGIILFEMLIGREEFNRISEQWSLNLRRGYKVNISAIESTYPDVFMIIDRAIEPDPSNRYNNADELITRLMPYYQSITGYSNAKIVSIKVILICENGKKLCLREGTTLIGRNIIDPNICHISERHCEIMVDRKTNVLIRDIGSKYGTSVNGDRIDHQWVNLSDNDVIELVDFKIRIRIA